MLKFSDNNRPGYSNFTVQSNENINPRIQRLSLSQIKKLPIYIIKSKNRLVNIEKEYLLVDRSPIPHREKDFLVNENKNKESLSVPKPARKKRAKSLMEISKKRFDVKGTKKCNNFTHKDQIQELELVPLSSYADLIQQNKETYTYFPINNQSRSLLGPASPEHEVGPSRNQNGSCGNSYQSQNTISPAGSFEEMFYRHISQKNTSMKIYRNNSPNSDNDSSVRFISCIDFNLGEKSPARNNMVEKEYLSRSMLSVSKRSRRIRRTLSDSYIETSNLDSDDDSLLICPICLDDLEINSTVRMLPCGHKYHLECIDNWLLNKSPLCPYCKSDVRIAMEDNDTNVPSVRINVQDEIGAEIRNNSNEIPGADNTSNSPNFLVDSRIYQSLKGIFLMIKSRLV
ncbi:Receptor homology region, transmembrane domain- and RING domain-containing protein 2 [Smittium culicis]|uniref:Receptor homology region, transmembrane domain-and RING domain-containing protein 2 n=1 Tax=Smittium culicis TaxID=133412 RepID=A0A1R1YGX2_9FUNG|nr:Receptor homology region, transmembrane domain- and RING domain-containing protein 2 [Smittium culicis]